MCEELFSSVAVVGEKLILLPTALDLPHRATLFPIKLSARMCATPSGPKTTPSSAVLCNYPTASVCPDTSPVQPLGAACALSLSLPPSGYNDARLPSHTALYTPHAQL